ncbi:MAG: 2-amino-4-hydroxy-6-hydroxymethyldihydropteridine diphosphokinase, partial [Thermodesulfobacteriota bacterium]|nr:2-amino-4-hydroxy-6-hydroxymethyldihydropteridine diphosphokinase [Thermodesulfobacteriota bacterium]
MELLDELDTTTITDVSSFYTTEPVDFTNQEWFVNAAFKIETVLDPFDLMLTLQRIENRAGQFEKDVRFGPRILDLDIIFFANKVINDPHLNIPHPRMDKRCFVLKPLCDIASKFVHPVSGLTMERLLKEIENKHDQKVIHYKTPRHNKFRKFVFLNS